MTLHPLASGFGSVADTYERGRPEYPRAAVGALAAELELPPGARVLDLGAGTGKLSRALLAVGFDVIAVEPQGSLRDVLAAKIGATRVVEGVAESIPLPDSSVDGVTAADAFHWFDRSRAVEEIRRVLRPRGGLAILSTVPDWSGASWAHELGQLVSGSRPEHPHFDGPPWQDAIRSAGGWTEPSEVRVIAYQPADPERIVAHMASISWIAAMQDDDRLALLERMRAVVSSGDTPDHFPIQVVIGLTRLAD